MPVPHASCHSCQNSFCFFKVCRRASARDSDTIIRTKCSSVYSEQNRERVLLSYNRIYVFNFTAFYTAHANAISIIVCVCANEKAESLQLSLQEKKNNNHQFTLFTFLFVSHSVSPQNIYGKLFSCFCKSKKERKHFFSIIRCFLIQPLP